MDGPYWKCIPAQGCRSKNWLVSMMKNCGLMDCSERSGRDGLLEKWVCEEEVHAFSQER